jgi:hypothetical protein
MVKESNELLFEVEKALKRLHHAEWMFNFTGNDPMAIDNAVYQIEAAKALYLMLLKRARDNKVAWDIQDLYPRLLKRA